MDLPKAREMAKAYREDPDLDSHAFMSELTQLPRVDAKALYLGIGYGQGGAKLCAALGLPTRWAMAHGKYRARRVLHYETRHEAFDARKGLPDVGRVWQAAGEGGQNILDQFHARAPFVGTVGERGAKTGGAAWIHHNGRRTKTTFSHKTGRFL